MNNYTLQDKIEKLNLSLRSTNALIKFGITNIEDLLKYPIEELHSIRNLGTKSILEIESCIVKLQEIFIDTTGNIATNIVSEDIFSYGYSTYRNVFIEDLNLSVRTYFCLSMSSICSLSGISQNMGTLSDIKCLSKECFNEIEDVFNNSLYKVKSKTNEYDRFVKILISYVKADDNINYNRLYNEVLYIFEEYYKESSEELKNCFTNKTFLRKIYSYQNIKDIFKPNLLECIKSNHFGCSVDTIKDYLPKYFNINYFILPILDELVSEGLIEKCSEYKYQMIYPSILDSVKPILDAREYQIFKLRLEGHPLEDVGDKFQVTRERIRQIEVRYVRKIKNKELFLREDIYTDVISKYKFSKQEFISCFKEKELTFNYLKIFYDFGRLDIELLVDDSDIPEKFRLAVEREEHKKYIFVGGSVLNRNNKELTEYAVRLFAIDDIYFNCFYSQYKLLLQELNLGKEDKFLVDEKRIRNIILESKFALWKRGDKFRYYSVLI